MASGVAYEVQRFVMNPVPNSNVDFELVDSKVVPAEPFLSQLQSGEIHWQLIGIDAIEFVNRCKNDVCRSETHHPQAFQYGNVNRAGYHHPDLRGTGESLLVIVPALPLEQRPSRRGQAGKPARRRRGAEADGRLARQVEQFQDPPCRNFLYAIGSGRVRERRRALVPGDGNALRRCRGGQRRTDDEPIVVRPIGGHRRRAACVIQQPDRTFGRLSGFGYRLVECLEPRECRRIREYTSRTRIFEIAAGALVGLPQQFEFFHCLLPG